MLVVKGLKEENKLESSLVFQRGVSDDYFDSLKVDYDSVGDKTKILDNKDSLVIDEEFVFLDKEGKIVISNMTEDYGSKGEEQHIITKKIGFKEGVTTKLRIFPLKDYLYCQYLEGDLLVGDEGNWVTYKGKGDDGEINLNFKQSVETYWICSYNLIKPLLTGLKPEGVESITNIICEISVTIIHDSTELTLLNYQILTRGKQ